MSLVSLSATELSKKLHEKEVSSVELTQMYLDRIKQLNPTLNAYVSVNEKSALASATEADDLIGKGKGSFLTGIPCGLKDVFCEQGAETTACSNILKGFTPPYDATSVARLRQAGGVFLGHTNTDEFTMGASSETSAFGVTKNPFDTSRVAGGSSGGSACAVGADLSVFSMGTDTGGSIRQPASFCGCSGLKVTYGRVSRSGVMSMASSLDTIGPMGKSCEDLAHIMNVIAGPDSADMTTPQVEVPDYTKHLEESLQGKKIGIPKEYFIDGIEGDVDTAVKDAIKVYEKMGCEVKEVSLPHTKYAVAVYYIIAPSEISANMSRYDGLRFGPAAGDAESLQDFYGKNRERGFGDEVKRRIMIGTYALSAGYFDAYYLKAQKVRTLIQQDFDTVFGEVDFLLTPTSPTTAFGIGENADDPLKMYLADIFTVASSLAGVCGLSIPCGLDGSGLPIGLQILGPQFGEETILNAGHRYQMETDFHKSKPSV